MAIISAKKNGNKFVKEEHLFVETVTPFCPERGTWFLSKRDACAEFTGNEVGTGFVSMNHEGVEYFQATVYNVYD